ncbi:MAG: alpha/beta hydrolase [Bacteroidetes bacterium]|nr:alpha/beta hydrolase [Bacteroidota bacterium]
MTLSSKPLVIGQVQEISSTQLGEKRSLNIYLPEGYNENDTTRYPVVFLLDGGTSEDFIHAVGLYQFYSFPWVNIAPPSIIVGIVNVDRRRDFTFPTTISDDSKAYPTTGHSDRFIAFLSKELLPYIDQHFRTTPARTLIGESLGGLLATQILQTVPSLFNNYIIVSPSLWWNNGSILTQDFEQICKENKGKTNVFIAVGKEGLAPTKTPRLMEVDANTLAEKLVDCSSKRLRVKFDYLGEENHATIMHQALMNALKFLNDSTEKK